MTDVVLAALADIVIRLDRIESALTALRSAPPTPPATSRRLLSLRAAAKLLGINRDTTLSTLIKDRRIKVVTVAGRPRIPVSEIERIEREGTARYENLPSRKTRARRAGAAGDVGAAIRAIRIE